MCRALLPIIVVLVACSGMEPVPLETVTGLGPGASLGGRRPFPDDNPWNRDISNAAVDPNIADTALRYVDSG